MDPSNQRDFQHLLRRVTDLVKKARPDELAALLKGDARLEIVYKKQGSKSAKTMADLDYDESWLNIVIADLQKSETRVEGERVLRAARLRKAQLQRMCRLMDVPYQTKDTMGHLRDTLVDATIGVRLRSRAILAR
jgi:hypothetical protein